jgi:hypothetical protein
MQMNKVDKKDKKPKGFGRRQSDTRDAEEGALSDGANQFGGSMKKKRRGGSNGSVSPGQ